LKELGFNRTFFVPNVAGLAAGADNNNSRENIDKQIERCHHHVQIWGENSVAAVSVYEALKMIDGELSSTSNGNSKPQVLVTGSLYLVGAFLSILDPDLSLSTKC
jgi:folylpolyglutamate synthase/dihydropteroate synthase